MNIDYGEAGAAAGGVAKGLGKAADIKREKQEQLDIEARAKEWEKEKMLLRSQQDFLHEQRLRQADLDREARAQEWYNEKLEIASKEDFRIQEEDRIRRKATLYSGMETINNCDAPENEKAKARFELKRQFPDIDGFEDVLGFARQEFQDELYQGLTPEEIDKAKRIKLGLEPRATVTRGQFQTLSPEEKYQADRIAAGLLPRASRPENKTYADVQKEMEARDIVMARIPSFSETDLAELGLTEKGLATIPEFNAAIKVNSEEEFLNLPAGTKAILPDGTIVTR